MFLLLSLSESRCLRLDVYLTEKAIIIKQVQELGVWWCCVGVVVHDVVVCRLLLRGGVVVLAVAVSGTVVVVLDVAVVCWMWRWCGGSVGCGGGVVVVLDVEGVRRR